MSLTESQETFRLTIAKAQEGLASVKEPEDDQALSSMPNTQENIEPPHQLQPEGWPELKEEALHGISGDIVKCLLPTTEADPAALLVHFLAEFSCYIGRKPHVRLDGAYNPLLFWPVLVGETGKSRKGSAGKRIARIYKLAFETWDRGSGRGSLSSGEGLAFAVRDPVTKMEPVREKGTITGEVKEVLVDEGVADKRLFLVQTEYGGMLRIMSRDGNSLSGVLRDAWDGEDLRPMTKSARVSATEPHIVVVGHVTREELVRHLNDTEAANGFGNRFVWFAVRRSKALPFARDVDLHQLRPLLKQLQSSAAYAQNVETIELTPSAARDWEMVYGDISEGKPGLSGALIGRAEAHIRRIAALYALLDGQSLVDQAHLRAAIALWDYSEASVQMIFSDRLGDPIADAVYQSVKTRGSMAETEISALFGRNMPASRLVRAKHLLETQGRLVKSTIKTSGRPQIVWAIPIKNDRQRT